MVYTFDKPTANMRITPSEMANMIREQAIEEYNNDQRKATLEHQNQQSDYNEYIKNITSMVSEQQQMIGSRASFLSNTKTALMTECLFKLFKESSVTPLSSSDSVIARNLVNKFVIENTANELINNFATKNLLLSEFSRITKKYYDIVVEKCDEMSSTSDCRDFCIGQDVTDEFLKELEDVDTYDASKLIKQRVADAMSEFIDSNIEQKLEYEDIIKTAQEKMDTTDNEAVAEQYSMMAKRKINEMRLNREKNIFHCVVESLTNSVLKDDVLKQKYMNEATIDMDKVVNSAQLIYTMIEMVNTTNMVNVDEAYMNEYIKSLYK